MLLFIKAWGGSGTVELPFSTKVLARAGVCLFGSRRAECLAVWLTSSSSESDRVGSGLIGDGEIKVGTVLDAVREGEVDAGGKDLRWLDWV